MSPTGVLMEYLVIEFKRTMPLVMVQLGILEAPEAHIMKRWTYKVIDVLPGELRFYQEDTLTMKSMTFRHRYLYVNGMKVINNGNRDINAFKIAAHYQKPAQKKLDQYFKSLEKSQKENQHIKKDKRIDMVFEVENCYTTSTDTGSESGLLEGNQEDLKQHVSRAARMRLYVRKRKATRNHSAGDQEQVDMQPGKRKIRCGKCDIQGHSGTSCNKIMVDIDTEIPEC